MMSTPKRIFVSSFTEDELRHLFWTTLWDLWLHEKGRLPYEYRKQILLKLLDMMDKDEDTINRTFKIWDL